MFTVSIVVSVKMWVFRQVTRITRISHYLNRCQLLSNTLQIIFFSFSKTVNRRMVRATQSNCGSAKFSTSLVLRYGPWQPRVETHRLYEDCRIMQQHKYESQVDKIDESNGDWLEFGKAVMTAFEWKDANSVFLYFASTEGLVICSRKQNQLVNA